MKAALSSEQLEALRRIDACTLANAIETFHERLRNEGFANGTVHCLFPQLGTMLGYAATVKIRGSAPPTADGPFPDRTDWFDYIQSLPSPRVVVVQDVASRVGLGSLLGAVHANILHALGCVGAVTNGSARDLPAVQELGFHLFTGGVAVSHAYVHIVEFGGPVEIAGLKIKSGDLLHGDQHGLQNVPLDIAAKIPPVAGRILEKEKALIALCRSRDFSLEKLRAFVAGNT
ncbi:MAG TPA: RraA family protein [Verrucomicrobiae bacterium]|jgi:4-hydroxy-4-methyl-2-oxoglutarate aldolase|nr:RraA family protein [Verrucomicrobiae bacterium]